MMMALLGMWDYTLKPFLRSPLVFTAEIPDTISGNHVTER